MKKDEKHYYITFGVNAFVEGTVEKTFTCTPSELSSKVLEAIQNIDGKTKRVLSHVSKGKKFIHVSVMTKDKIEGY